MAQEEILVERQAAIACITLNRRGKRNPLGLGFSSAMHRALDEVEGDPGIAAVVLTVTLFNCLYEKMGAEKAICIAAFVAFLITALIGFCFKPILGE